MLKSSNLNSVIDQLDADRHVSDDADAAKEQSTIGDDKMQTKPDENKCSLAAMQMSFGVLEILEPPVINIRGQLKELIGKQNKIYIDLSEEKYKLDCTKISKLIEMMNQVKVYREKLMKIKKDMHNIYQRSKVLKKRAANIAACKQRDSQRKLEKQQHEESLIGSQSH